jgi:hypothetical protein
MSKLLEGASLPAPGFCFICEQKPKGAQWIDYEREFHPEYATTSLSGRKIVCSNCITEGAKHIGLITNEAMTKAKLESQESRALASAWRQRFKQFADELTAEELETAFRDVVSGDMLAAELAAIEENEDALAVV